ncbi:unnamed protein product [Protopolystoma xenopodis]|uniref:Uncharacterized protein n=1 Tax=Protopolystoma xenopodis TaxID=117903 RepID=A0A3S5A1X9_9PLAT|nr:unnamed protein product [Protopolystoma xenopodis]
MRHLNYLTASLPKLYWFILNGNHTPTTPSLDYRKSSPPPPFFIAIHFPPVSDRSMIKASPLCWPFSSLVYFELVAWWGKWQHSLMVQIMRPEKRLKM